MSKNGDRLRDRAEELRTNADNIRAEECHRISLELAETAEALADQWDAIAVTMVSYLGDPVVPFRQPRSDVHNAALRCNVAGMPGDQLRQRSRIDL